MATAPVVHHTFQLERSYRAPVERVFAAFADAARKRLWYGEGETREVEEFIHEFRVGGVERLKYRLREGTPFPGATILNEGVYQDIVDSSRIVSSSAMLFEGRTISVSLVTFEFAARDGGTELICTHQGAFFEGSGGPEMREAGWVSLLERLKSELAA